MPQLVIESARALKEQLEEEGKVDVRECVGFAILVVGYAGCNWLVTPSATIAGRAWKGQIKHVETAADVYRLVGVRP